jgi:ribonuclease HI
MMPGGTAKLNVDGTFSPHGAGTGMVLRDHEGQVIYATCRELKQCRNATEAEMMTIKEGMQLALHWSPSDFKIETDCAEATELIKDSTPNSSIYAFSFRISVICELFREKVTRLAKISRDANMVSHELARVRRVHKKTAVIKT